MTKEVYDIVLVLSAVVIFISGIILLFHYVPADTKLYKYRIACRLLSLAFILLATLKIINIFIHIGVMIHIIVAYFQALLFTYSLITLFSPRFVTLKRLIWLIAIIISLSCISVYLYLRQGAGITAALIVSITGYMTLFIHYIYAFIKEYKHSDSDRLELLWIRKLFFTSAFVGLLAAVMVRYSITVLILFTIVYTIFYLYFAVKYIDYPAAFNLLVPAAEILPPETKGNLHEMAENNIREAIERWIDNKGFLDSNLSLDILSKELCTNTTYLSHYINLNYGRNFKSWVNSLRVDESCKLLSEREDIPIGEVGDMVGIPSSSTFYRQFVTLKGMTPAKYRKNNRTISR